MSKVESVEIDAPRPLKPEVVELSEKITPSLSLNKTDGVITESTSSYIENLPEGITPDIDTSLTNYRKTFVAASLHSVGTMAVEAMAKNKKLDNVTAELKMGDDDCVRHSVDREKTYKFGSGAEAKTTTKHGVVTTEVDIKGGHNSGQLKLARAHVGTLAASKLDK